MTWQRLRFALRHLPLIAEAWGWLLLARFRHRPFPVSAPTHRSHPPEVLLRCFQIAAGHHLYRPTCLPRSIALHRFLNRHGHPAAFQIGVRKEGKGLKAHAWVETGSQVVDDDPGNTANYHKLES